MLVKDKHSSLLRQYVNYGRKKFYSTGPGRYRIFLFLSYACGAVWTHDIRIMSRVFYLSANQIIQFPNLGSDEVYSRKLDKNTDLLTLKIECIKTFIKIEKQ